MPTTYEAIATVTVGSGGAASIDFTSIPATYTDLTLLCSLRDAYAISGVNTQLRIRFNGDSTNVYSDRNLYGDGSTAASYSRSSQSYVRNSSVPTALATSSTFGNTIIYIPNYGSSNNKSISFDGVAENNATAANAELTAGLWENTAAITSIVISSQSGANFVQHSSATLYGIKNS
jgi:hypothetical protein